MIENTDFMESRMLHAYLDGELDGAHEEVLFRTLSENPALRAEMQDHLAIRKAIQFDAKAFTPPAAATAAIFSALDFSIPSTAKANPAGGAGRFWFASGSAVLAVATSLLLSTLFPSTNEATSARIESTRPDLILRIDEAPILPDAAIATPSSTPTVPVFDSGDQATIAAVSSEAIVASAAPVSDISPRPAASFQTRGEPDLRGVRAPFVAYVNLLRITPDGMVMYARNSSLQTQPSTVIGSGSSFPLADMNLGALLPLSSRHYVGLEFGRETFPQSFSGTLRGASVQYEQSPAAYCVTAVYQFNAGELLPLIRPYWQLQVGGAYNLGPLAKAGIGVAIRPFDRIAVLVGAEGSILAYKFQDRWFDTRKLGLTYGLRYEF